MKNKLSQEIIKFIDKSPTAFHAVENIVEALNKDSFSQYDEKDSWKLWKGMKGYVVRNDSSVIAFMVPRTEKIKGFKLYLAHSDSPSFKLKENPETGTECGVCRLDTEKYGGMILSSWFDRPLSVAGRITYEENKKLVNKTVNIDRDLLIIPNVAIHMNPELNDGYKYKAQSDLLPLFRLSNSKTGIMKLISKESGIDEKKILGSDLFLYTRQKGTFLGADDEFVLAPRLDDLACVYTGLKAFLSIDSGDEKSTDSEYISVFGVFDNEEVGSGTAQGADSTFLEDVLFRIAESLSLSRTDYLRLIADSFALSADNAHAVHPAMPSKADIINKPVINGGVVLKFNAAMHYTTDGASAARVRSIAARAGVSLQNFANNSDVRGGSTLGNISTAHASIPTADVGLAQYAMHSACETMGAGDADDLFKLVKTFFGE